VVPTGGAPRRGGHGPFLAIRLRLLEDYQIVRLTSFLDPGSAPEVGYQVTNSKMAIGSGGLTGKGLGASSTLGNLGYLPEDRTDFIFANFAEKVGFLGAGAMLLLFLLLIWRVLHAATVSRDRFGVLVAVGGCRDAHLPRAREHQDGDGHDAGDGAAAVFRELQAEQPSRQPALGGARPERRIRSRLESDGNFTPGRSGPLRRLGGGRRRAVRPAASNAALPSPDGVIHEAAGTSRAGADKGSNGARRQPTSAGR
jgi:hypothetical protein